MRCLYCLHTLDLVVAGPWSMCKRCGTKYDNEILATLNTEEFLDNPRYRIERRAGTPPEVLITDLQAWRRWEEQ